MSGQQQWFCGVPRRHGFAAYGHGAPLCSSPGFNGGKSGPCVKIDYRAFTWTAKGLHKGLAFFTKLLAQDLAAGRISSTR